MTGPYPITPGDILYPPVALWLFVPFTVLPAALWWIVPVAITTLVVWHLRPAFVAWPFLALCIAWPPTIVKLATGNPVLWVTAAMAVGVIYLGAAGCRNHQASLFPFAFFGASSRRWWIILAVFLGMCVPFAWMWSDWLKTVVNVEGGGVVHIRSRRSRWWPSR